MKPLFPSRQVLWFLFLFNLAAAVAAGFALHGTQQLLTSAAMGAVSLGAASAAGPARRTPTALPTAGQDRCWAWRPSR